jgi:hypothetical protein
MHFGLNGKKTERKYLFYEDFFQFLAVKLGHLKVHTIFSSASNTQA